MAHAIRALAASCLVLWIGLLPLGQMLHLASASHGHRQCPTHNQIEDVAEGQGSSVDDALAGPTVRDNSTPERHVACSVLNWDISRKLYLSHPGFSPSPASRPAAVEAETVATFHIPWALILIAPKNSPPLSLV
jgi:hypothetical protein